MERIRKLNEAYPPVAELQVDELLAEELRRSTVKLVVLDDDPTGVQTVHGVSVYTDWSTDSLAMGLAENRRLFFVLTNSRAMTASETAQVHKEIIDNLFAAAERVSVPFLVMSRSDSTLRGHFPLETKVLRDGMEGHGMSVDGEILCPFFLEGGRYTVENIHYVKYGDTLVPSGETEFAKDKSFGYRSSDLPGYIEEKTEGAYPASAVTCISLESLRRQDYEAITQQLLAVSDFGKVCVNAADYGDLKVFAVALYRALALGKRFLFRTAAGLVQVLGGVPKRPLLTVRELCSDVPKVGGVVVVGSHTEKTTRQLQALLTLPNTVAIEMASDLVLQGRAALMDEVRRCVELEQQCIQEGKTAVVFTKRTLLSLPEDTKESALRRSVLISDAVQRLVGDLTVTPAFVVAKGGITSSDVGTKALGVKKAEVLGQIQPGVPVWKTREESRFPHIPYVIFPGNVGEDDTLKRTVEVFTSK